MQFSEILSGVRDVIKEASGNSGFSDAFLKGLINEGWRMRIIPRILESRRVAHKFFRSLTVLTNVYTTVSSSSTGTTLNVTSADNIFAGQELYVKYDENIYEKVTVSSIAGTVITLVSPGLSLTHDSGNTVLSSHLQLPEGTRQILNLKAETVSTTEQKTFTLVKIREKDVDNLYPRLKSEAAPSHYFRSSRDLWVYPLPDDDWNYRVKYVALPSEMSNDTDTPTGLPEEYHHLLVKYAAFQAVRTDVRAVTGAAANFMQMWEADFERGLERMMVENMYEIDDYNSIKREDDTSLPSIGW